MHPCEVCGAWGSFGYGVHLRAAIEKKNPAAAGKWFCHKHRPEEGEENGKAP